MGVADVGDPVADRGRDRLLERARARLDARDGRAEQPHALDVGHLAAHVLRAHVDDALEPEQRARGRGGHAVLAGAGLGDDPRLAHPLGEQALAERVVELVRARVHQVLALEPDRAAGRLGEALGVVERRRAAAEVALQAGRARRGSPRPRARRARPPRARRAPASASRGRTGRRRGRSGARPSTLMRATGAAAAAKNAASLSGSLIPGEASTPEATSTANGSTAAIPAATFSAVSPPERIAGTLRRRCAASAQSQVAPVPPRSPRAAVSSRWKSVWKRSRSWKSEASAMRIALIILAPVRRATSPQNAGPSSPWSWTCESCSASAACAISLEARVDEHADGLHAAPQGAGDPGRDGGVGGARRALPEDEAERPGTQLDRELGVLGTGDAADLDARHELQRSGMRAAATARPRPPGGRPASP